MAIAVLLIASCSNKRKPGTIYMPDMAYSRAVETYASTENLKDHGINYNGLPVKGTVKRASFLPFTIEKDKDGDTANYFASRQVPNPLAPLDPVQLKEAERLYLVNCGICHGTKLDGNGPLYNNGAGPYQAAPKDLIADPVVSVMPAGQMFYSIAYGKGQMGSYASQLSTEQRWMIIHYIQSKKKPAAAPSGATSTAKN